MNPPFRQGAVHIGDGVYASHDGYQIWLQVQREEGRVESVALEPGTFRELVQYALRLGLRL